MLKEGEDHKGRTREIGNPGAGVPRLTPPAPGALALIRDQTLLPGTTSEKSPNPPRACPAPAAFGVTPGTLHSYPRFPLPPTSICSCVPEGFPARIPPNPGVRGIFLLPLLSTELRGWELRGWELRGRQLRGRPCTASAVPARRERRPRPAGAIREQMMLGEDVMFGAAGCQVLISLSGAHGLGVSGALRLSQMWVDPSPPHQTPNSCSERRRG